MPLPFMPIFAVVCIVVSRREATGTRTKAKRLGRPARRSDHPKGIREFRYTYAYEGNDDQADTIEGFCEGLVRGNVSQIATDPDRYPCCLGCSDLKYVDPPICRDNRFCQPIKGAGPLIDSGEGTCIDLACLLAAMLRHKGDRKARVEIENETAYGKEIPGQYHAYVIDGKGARHDAQELVEAGTACAGGVCPL